MITAPEGFRRAIEDMRNRDYRMLITCTLASGTVLTIDNSRVWSSGFSYDDALCTTPDALEVGTAIINKVTLVINNQDEHYSAYDFGDAVLEIQIGLRPDDESPISYITKGIYTVDSASYNTMLITLTALDNMYKFDRLYTTIPQMPSTALALVQDACTVCGVTLGVQTFDGASTAVTVPPTEDVTYRQMISWIGQMIGCDWRINTAGELMPVWFNIESLGRFYDGGTFNYNDGAVLNGGTFAYNDGDSVDGGQFNDSGYFVINSLATANVAVDDTVITGVVVRVMNNASEEEAPDNAFTEYTAGQEGFCVVVENNPEITEDNVQAVLTTLGGRLIGMKYRKGQLMHLSDPRLEAGDVFVYADHKDHAYPMICSQAIFTLGEYQTTTSASAVPIRKAAERYGVQTQTTVQIYKSVLREKTSRETAEADLQDQIDNASGLYQTVQSDGQGGSIYLLHDRPTVAESNIIWKMSSSAFGVSTNGGQSYNAGLTADGTAIVQRLYSNTITAGILQSPDYAYSSGVYSSAGMLVDLSNKVIRATDFAVASDGHLYAKAGTVGGFDISSTQLRSDVTINGTTYYAVMQSMGTSTDTSRHAFLIGKKVGTASPTYPFYVRYDGYLKASSINGSFTVSPTSYVTITRSAGQSANPSMLTLNDLTDNYVADLRASQLALKPSSSSLYTATLSAIGGGQLILNSTANQLYGIRLIANSSYTSGEYVPLMILQGTTSATVSTYSSNPRIQFSNSNASQSLALVFTDHDTYQSPASLTLVGNQGGEYFIAPNIKIKDGGLTVAHSDSSGTSVRLQNNNHDGSFAISTSGTLMLWSITNQLALIQMSVDGITKVRCPNGMYRPVGTTDTDGSRVGAFQTPSATTLRVYAQKGTAGASYGGYITFTGTSSSDIRLKRNIKPVEVKALPLINSIELKSFDWIHGQRDYTHQPIGMIADQIEKLDSRLVIGGGYDPDGTPNYKVIDDHYLVCYLTKAVQELSAEIERMKAS